MHKSPDNDQLTAELIRSRVGQFAPRSMYLLILFGIKKNYLRSGRSRSIYLFTWKVIKWIVVIIEAHHFCQLRTVQTFIQHSAVEVNSICRRIYWRSSVWISMQQINYWWYILNSSDIWENVGIRRSSASSINSLQEKLWFS
jgi:hypothetical protein